MDPLRLDVVVLPELVVDPVETGAVLHDNRIVILRDCLGDQAEEQVQVPIP